MYSFASPRVMTRDLEEEFRTRVTHAYAVTAKDDPVSHFYDPLVYVHPGNLVVLNTNIKNRDDDGCGRYMEVGATRIEHGPGDAYRGCIILGAPDVGPLLVGDYGKRGHDQIQYIKRLEGVASIPNIPFIQLRIVDGSVTQIGDRLELRWDGGVQGPCDWVGLYSTDKDGAAPTVAGSYIKLVDGWEWVVRGEGYATEPPNVVESAHATNKDPSGSVDECKDFWICYVDGFDTIIRTSRFTGHRDPDADCDDDGVRTTRDTVSLRTSPNPTTAAVDVRFSTAGLEGVRLSVFDVKGRLVRALPLGVKPPGDHSARWDLRDGSGVAVSAGVYFLRLEMGERAVVQKVTITR